MNPDSTQLHRLIYISHAVRPFSAAALDQLLTGARAFNATIGVTGLLLYHDGNFIQAIEGPAASLTALMVKIRDDRRHGGIIIMNAAQVGSREFPDWSMGYAAPDKLSSTQREGFHNLRSFASKRAFEKTNDAEVQIQVEAFLSTFREFEPD